MPAESKPQPDDEQAGESRHDEDEPYYGEADEGQPLYGESQTAGEGEAPQE